LYGGDKLDQTEFAKQTANSLKEKFKNYLLVTVSENDGTYISGQLAQEDALLVIAKLIEIYNLKPDAVAYACKNYRELYKHIRRQLM
jgi:hypothetical protein